MAGLFYECKKEKRKITPEEKAKTIKQIMNQKGPLRK